MILIWIGLALFTCGGIYGKKLANEGITANNALHNQEKKVLFFLVAIGIIIFSLIIIDRFHVAYLLPLIIPSPILLYLGAYFDELITSLCFFSLGLILILELSGKFKIQDLVQLCLALGIIVCALVALLHFYLPINNLDTQPKIIKGIVLQTKSYTCAPSSIATLARFVGKHPQITENDVVKLAGTSLSGTSTLGEIKALEKLGLNPEYKHNLSVEDLIKIAKPAVLHVRERDGKKIFSHAVALLVINPEKQIVTIANPLFGIQIKSFEQLKNYWFGEAVFITS